MLSLSWAADVVGRMLFAGTTLLVVYSLASPAIADPPSGDDLAGKVHAFSTSGEFTRAMVVAGQIPDRAVRDDAYATVSKFQMAAGLSAPAVETASYVSDDETRAQMLTDIALKRQSRAAGAPGGAVEPDFESLMELITTTVQPESWEELGGPGTIAPFETGVYVDSQGTLRRVTQLKDNTLLSAIHQAARTATANTSLAVASPLRKVSLTRLEKEAQLRWAMGKPPTDEMLYLAGIYEVKYILVYPEQNEIVLAGPAGAWQANAEGRVVNQDTGRPVLHLDDLVVLLRNAVSENGRFGCAITPTQEGLKKSQEYLAQTSDKPLHPRQRDGWLKGLRDAIGKQEIDVYGISPETRAGRILVEADYHMKRIGMGLEDGTAGVPSYLEMVTIPPGGSPPPMDVLRWWFTLNYRAVQGTKERNAFELVGPGVQVQSENELLDDQGNRIHTGASSSLNSTFARNFTKEYAALSVKYPIYGELKNIFDLALACSLMEKERMADQVGWHMTHFNKTYQVSTAPAPKDVETIMNMRVIDRKHIIAGVSGGVRFDPAEILVAENLKIDEYGLMKADHQAAKTPEDLPHHGWWWD